MKELGWKGLLLLSALAVASPAIVHAQDSGGGGNTGAGGSNDNDAGKADDGSTGTVGGAGAGPGGTSGGTGEGYDSQGAVSPNDDSPANNPCPEGYALSTTADNVCVKQ